jgi:recombinational DNA repair protein (RecF pathway)
MRRENHPICFQCGQTTGDLTRFNRLHDGRACPACADRLLAALPSLLPRKSAPTELAQAVENDLDDSDDTGFDAGA